MSKKDKKQVMYFTHQDTGERVKVVISSAGAQPGQVKVIPLPCSEVSTGKALETR